MTNFESPIHSAIPERRSYGRLVPIAAAGMLLLSGCEVPSDAPDNPPTSSATESPDVEYVTPGCTSVTSNEIAQVRKILNTPNDEHVTENNNIDASGRTVLSDEQFRVWQHSVAQKDGFELKDSPTNNMNQGERDMFLNNTPATFYGVVDFVKDYGLTLTVPNSEKLLDGIDASPIKLGNFWKDRNAAANLVELRNIIQKYPLDYFKRLDINEIALVDGDDDVERSNGEKLAVGGEVNLDKHPNAIYISYDSAGTLDHEMTHVADKRMGCDASDLGFEMLNEGVDVYEGADVYGVKGPEGVYNLDSFANENKKRRPPQLPLNPSEIYTTTDYAMINEQEDKAELNARIQTRGGLATLCRSNILMNKASFLLARFKAWYPGYTKYLLQTSERCVKKSD